jgi:hypothetical protein
MPKGPKAPRITVPKGAAGRMPKAPAMPMGGTPNISGRAMRAPKMPSMPRIKP